MKDTLSKKQTKILIFLGKALRTFLLFGLVFIIILPFIEIFINSIKSNTDIAQNNVYWIPEHPTLRKLISSFKQLFQRNAFINSILLSTTTAILQIISCAIFGYAFAKLKFKGSNILLTIIMFSLFVPLETLHTARTIYMTFHSFFGIKLIGNKYSIFIMTLFGAGYYSPIFIYIFRQYFRNIPSDIYEQAQIDGASNFKTFFHIILPNAQGAIVTCGLLTFVYAYNDTYFPTLYNFHSNKIYLLATSLSSGRYYNISSTALMMIIPLLLIYILTQKYLIDNIKKSVIL